MKFGRALMMAAAAAAMLVSPSMAQQQVGTKVVHIPAEANSNSKVEVHVVQEQGRIPNAAPKPPVSAAALAGAGIATFPAAGPSPCGNPSGCGQQQQPVPNMAALPVLTPAAQLNAPVEPITGMLGGTGSGQPLVTMGLQTVAGAKIVGVDDKCGCPNQPQANPCNNPCKPVRTVADEIESRLTDVKNEIVNRAQKLQADNMWVKQVKQVIQHYTEKIRAVGQSNTALKSDIKKLFAKKKHYEDLLMQYSIDRDHFNRVVQQQTVQAQ